jgi:hypothetical protein
MHDQRDEAAALNNAEWCAAVWRSHSLPFEQAQGLWFCRRKTPRYYPNVVTVELGANAIDQAAFIGDLQRSSPALDLSVKDSFASLDLHAAGMKPLFDARWLLRPASVAGALNAALQWRRIADERGLAAWESAWRAADEDSQRIFVPQLLTDLRAFVLAGYDERDAIRAGGIAYDAAGALGLTNVFGSGREFLQALASIRPQREMVCYAPGDSHRSADSNGFQVLGPLRIWVRAT